MLVERTEATFSCFDKRKNYKVRKDLIDWLFFSGVVERASKEISRRIHSLGFKTSSKKNNKSSDDSDTTTATTTAATDSGDPGEGATAAPDSAKAVSEKKKVGTAAGKADKQQQLLNESDRLNGNNPSPQTQQDRGEHGVAPQTGLVSTPPGSPSPSGYRNMGSIIKGSVMDKVTNVFSGGQSNNMGNTSNKDSNSASAAANSAAASASAAAAASKASDASATAANNAINIPKGKKMFKPQ